MRAGALALAGLAAVASVLLVVALVTGAHRIVAAYGVLAPTFGDGLGVTLLGLAYLPNAAVGALSWAVGAGFTVGTATISPFDAKPGVPSSFPLLAALPTGVPPVWAPAVLALPVLLGMLVGLSVRRALPVPADRIRATVVAGLVAASGATLLALLAGGRLAAGPYDPVRFPPELIAPATLLWIGGIAAVVVILRRPVDDPVYVEVVDPEGPVRVPAAETSVDDGGPAVTPWTDVDADPSMIPETLARVDDPVADAGGRAPVDDGAEDDEDEAPGGPRARAADDAEDAGATPTVPDPSTAVTPDAALALGAAEAVRPTPAGPHRRNAGPEAPPRPSPTWSRSGRRRSGRRAGHDSR